MWLINSTTEQLEAVSDPGGYQYAILSHTWDKAGEPSFQDFQSEWRDERKFRKVKETCRLARNHDIPYAWVDSCCIDKTSSTELSEAINSMFRWYKQSTVCFVHLCDLSHSDSPADYWDLRNCNWFRRGWTLQELIASEKLEIYDMTWALRGDKTSHISALSQITGIDTAILKDSNLLSTISVARRMSWSWNRQTSRLEDQAYCLFGIFDVNLPLIYGEGRKAFIRLQEAIVQNSDDLTLFAWTTPDHSDEIQRYRGIFAESPSYFESCGGIYQLDNPEAPEIEFVVTNLGLRFTAQAYDSETRSGENDILLNLQCFDKTRQHNNGSDSTVFIRLMRTSFGYVRHCSGQHIVDNPAHISSPKMITVRIPKTVNPIESETLYQKLRQNFFVTITNTTSFKTEIIDQSPRHLWLEQAGSFITNGSSSFIGVIRIRVSGGSYSTALFQPEKEKIWELHGPDEYSWPDALILLGFSGAKPEESGTALYSIQPWAAIYGEEEAKDILYYLNQGHDCGVIHAFDRIRASMRSRLKDNPKLQMQITVVPSLWLRHRAALIDPNKVNKIVLIRDRPKIKEFIYKDSLRICLSIAELEGAVSTSYNLKVTLERE